MISRFHGRWPMLQFDDFTPYDPCCNLTISGRRPMLQFDIFTAIGSCFDLTISCACSSAHRFHFFTWGKGTNCFQSPRKSADHSIASFHGKLADRSMATFHGSRFHEFTHSSHNSSLFSFFQFWVSFFYFRTFFFQKTQYLGQTDRQTNERTH